MDGQQRCTWIHWTTTTECCCSKDWTTATDCCWSKAPAVPTRSQAAASLSCWGPPASCLLGEWLPLVEKASCWRKWLGLVEKATTKFPRDAALAQVKVARKAIEPEKQEHVLFKLLEFLILNLLDPVDLSLPTTGQLELLQAKGGPLACDKMCKVSKMFRYRLDSGSVILTDDGTHFGIDVGPF